MAEESRKRVCAHVIVRGRVQGVCFRMETVQVAQHYGVTGWVRNRPDGAVEACFSGEQTAVNAVVAWCRHGPAGAHVDDLELTWQTPQEDFRDFQIRW